MIIAVLIPECQKDSKLVRNHRSSQWNTLYSWWCSRPLQCRHWPPEPWQCHQAEVDLSSEPQCWWYCPPCCLRWSWRWWSWTVNINDICNHYMLWCLPKRRRPYSALILSVESVKVRGSSQVVPLQSNEKVAVTIMFVLFWSGHNTWGLSTSLSEQSPPCNTAPGCQSDHVFWIATTTTTTMMSLLPWGRPR